MDDITTWLQQLGLGQYAGAFIANDISLSVLPELTDQDLKDIGVTSLGHRRLLLRAIAERNAARRRNTRSMTRLHNLSMPS